MEHCELYILTAPWFFLLTNDAGSVSSGQADLQSRAGPTSSILSGFLNSPSTWCTKPALEGREELEIAKAKALVHLQSIA